VSRAYLFYLLAFEGDETALRILQEVPLAMPVPGRAAPAGSWLALPAIVRGLTLLGRTEQVAALHPAMETLAGSGLVVHYTLTETDAGIAAAAAGNWAAAENHHQAAISQAEAMPFPIGQADAREWYADMLLARNRTGDADRGRALLVDAVTLYGALGMTGHARRAGSRVGCL
jgi:hypothetical protein